MLTSPGAVRKVSPYHQFPSNKPIAIAWLHRQRVAQQPTSDLSDLVLRRWRQLSPNSSIWWSLALSAHSIANRHRPFTWSRNRNQVADDHVVTSVLWIPSPFLDTPRHPRNSYHLPVRLFRILQNAGSWTAFCVVTTCDVTTSTTSTSQARPKKSANNTLETIIWTRTSDLFRHEYVLPKKCPSSPNQSQSSYGLSIAMHQASAQTFPR